MSVVFDLRNVFMAVINVVKPSMAPEDHSWDAFGVFSNPTWTKFCLVFILLFLFSIVSVKISLNFPVLIRAQNFSAILLISFLASLILPELLFWYIYPIILLSSFRCVSTVIERFGSSIQAILSSGLETHVNTDDEIDLEIGQQPEGVGSEEDE